jgi:cytochrome P450
MPDENLTIPKGQYITVDATRTDDPTLHEHPEKFDIYRWVRMGENPEYEKKAQFVNTSSEHLIFGHGIHACPGRFFASNTLKIALCHLLLKYDWELAPGITTDLPTFGTANVVDPTKTFMFKKRDAEIDLESLEFD